MKLRTVLRVEHKAQFAGSKSAFAKGLPEERANKIRESDTRLETVLYEILVAVSAQALYSLKSTTCLQAQKLRTTEQIPVLI